LGEFEGVLNPLRGAIHRVVLSPITVLVGQDELEHGSSMSNSLCIHCGNIKFGAFNPCPRCGTPLEIQTDAKIPLELYLSVHFCTEESLRAVGAVIESINQQIPSKEIARYVVGMFMNKVEPGLFTITLPAKTRDEILNAYNSMEFPEGLKLERSEIWSKFGNEGQDNESGK
jgi:hypothetical protein